MDISIYEPQVPDPTGSHFDPRPKLGTAHDPRFLPVVPISAQEAMMASGVYGISCFFSRERLSAGSSNSGGL